MSDRLFFSYSFQYPSLHTSLSYSPSPSNYSFPVSPPTSDIAYPAIIPRISILVCSHHCLDSYSHGFCSAAIHNSMIGRVTIFSNVFWWQAIYTLISSSPTVSQWVDTTMSHPVNVWGPCLPSLVPPSGGNPQGTYPDRGSLPTSRTEIEAPRVPLPHKISPLFSYPLPPSPKASPVIPTLSAPAIGSVPPIRQSLSEDNNVRPK